MNTTLLFIVAGSVLGLLQIAAGVAIGRWLWRPLPASRDADLRRSRSLALQLHGLTQKVTASVADHRNRFEQMQSRLDSSPAGRPNPTTDLVVGVVGEILEANRKLQSELHEAEDLIAEQALEIESHLNTSLTDSLTKLPNRRAFDDQLAVNLQNFRKHGAPFSLMMVDFDHFKQINDTFGHPVGDDVLRGMAGVLRAALRKNDFIARYGGEEFAVVLPHTTLGESEIAATKARTGVAQLAEQFQHLNRELTVSSGVASLQAGESVESLIERADQALYMAKRNGRDCTYLHNGESCELLMLKSADRSVGKRTNEAPPHELAPVVDAELESGAIIAACNDLRQAMQEAVVVEAK